MKGNDNLQHVLHQKPYYYFGEFVSFILYYIGPISEQILVMFLQLNVLHLFQAILKKVLQNDVDLWVLESILTSRAEKEYPFWR